MSGSGPKKLEIDEQIDDLANLTFDVFSKGLQTFLESHTKFDRKNIAIKWQDMTNADKIKYITRFVDHMTSPNSNRINFLTYHTRRERAQFGNISFQEYWAQLPQDKKAELNKLADENKPVPRDEWIIIPNLGLNVSGQNLTQAELLQQVRGPGPLDTQEEKKDDQPKMISTMQAPWLMLENKPVTFVGAKGKTFFVKPKQWTPVSHGLCALPGNGGFTLCDLTAIQKPKTQFIDLNKDAKSRTRVLEVKTMNVWSNGLFVGILSQDNDYSRLIVWDPKLQAIVNTEELGFPVDPTVDISIIIDQVNLQKFQMVRNYREEKENTHIDNYTISTDKDFIFISYSSPPIQFIGKLYGFTIEKSILNLYQFSLSTMDPKRRITLATFELQNKEGSKQAYMLNNNSIMLAEDDPIKQVRTLTYYEIQGREVKQIPVESGIPLFSDLRILPTGEAVYISKKETTKGVTDSTISVFSPSTKKTAPILKFEKDIIDLILAPHGNIGVCYVAKEGPRCDFYLLPGLALKPIILDKWSAGPEDVVSLIIDYLPEQRLSVREISPSELAPIINRITSFIAEQEARPPKKEMIHNREAQNLIDMLKLLQELLENHSDLSYEHIVAAVVERLDWVGLSRLKDKSSYIKLDELLADVLRLKSQDEHKHEGESPSPEKFSVVNQLNKLINQLENERTGYSSPERKNERINAASELLTLIKREKLPEPQELVAFRKKNRSALQWSPLGIIFDNIQKLSKPALPQGPRPK